MSETSQASSENEKGKRPRGPRKRQVHNEVERRRKDKINGWIGKISELLPCTELFKHSKIGILEKTVEYIKLLQSERDKLLNECQSEVQAEEVKKLKRDLKMLKEQNIMYENLLKEADINLTTLPKFPLKYSFKFCKRKRKPVSKYVTSLVQSLIDKESSKNSEKDTLSADTNTSLSTINVKNLSSNEVQKPSTIPVAKVTKTSSKSLQSVKKIAPDLANITSTLQSYVPINLLTSNQSFTVSPFPLATVASNFTQANVTALVNCGSVARNLTSIDSCGVTSVLSPFPVMSTTQGSSINNVCNKTMPTIIIPTGGNILQQFPSSEKGSNTISIICPTTLPFLVPQPVFNVSSMTKTVNLSSTILCPSPVNNPCLSSEKSALGNTLLTISPSSVVSITSAVPDATKVILPPPQFGNSVGIENAATSIIAASPQVSSNQLLVPLVPNLPDTSTSFAKQSIKVCKNITPQSSTISSVKNVNVSLVTNSETIPSLKPSISGKNNSELVMEPLNTTLKICDLADSSRAQNSTKKQVHNKQMQFASKIPPSLQVLSANKIISLANKSQKVKSNLILPLNDKASLKNTAVPLQSNTNESNQSLSNFCLQIDTPGVGTNFKLPTESSNILKDSEDNYVKSNISKTSDSNTVPTNFSLTALIGKSHSCGKQISDNITPNTVTLDSSEEKEDHIIKAKLAQNVASKQITTYNSRESNLRIRQSERMVVTSKSDQNENFNQEAISSSIDSNISNSRLDLVSASEHIVSKHVSQSTTNISNTSNCSNALNAKSSIEDTKTSVSCMTLCSPSNLALPIVTSYSTNTKHVSNSQQSNTNLTVQSDALSYVSKNTQFLQNGIIQAPPCPNPHVSSVMLESGNNSFSENVLSSNDSDLIQNITFQGSQPVNSNPNFVLNHASNQSNFCPQTFGPSLTLKYSNAASSPSNPANSTEYPNTSLHTYYVEKTKGVSEMPNSMSHVIAPHKVPPAEEEPFIKKNTSISSIVDLNSSNKISISSAGISDDAKQTSRNLIIHEYEKHPPKKKSKLVAKNCKLTQSSINTVCVDEGIPTKFGGIPKPTASGIDASACIRLESIFSSDILARATESIFGADVLDSPLLKKTSNQSEEGLNINSLIASSANRVNGLNCKLQVLNSNKETKNGNGTEKGQDQIASSSSKDKNTSNLSDMSDVSLLISAKSNLPLQSTSDMALTPISGMNSLNSVSDISDVDRIAQEHNKNKSCKSRKTKVISDNEPPSKKIKEILTGSDKVSNPQVFEQPPQVPKEHDKRVIQDIQLSMQCIDKDHAFVNDPTSIETIQLNNSLMQENNCKTPSSIDNVFSLTPMLGDILKDVPHAIGNNYDNQNFISFNYVNNASEDYLNLPRMYFPIVPEIQATNAHNISLCSTQSDSLKSTGTALSLELQNKFSSKKKPALTNSHNNHVAINHDLSPAVNAQKEMDCASKPNSVPQFNTVASKMANNNSLLGDQSINLQSSSSSAMHAPYTVNSHTSGHFNTRETYVQPAVSHSINFYSTSSSVSNVQQTNSSSVLPHSYNCSNPSGMTYSVQSVNPGTNSFNSSASLPKADSLSHSLCSLLKETTNILAENRVVSTASVTSSSASLTTSTNISQSKYSALSLISDQPYSESTPSSGCHSECIQAPVNYTPATSSLQFASASSVCSRNPRTSLSYSAESLLQTSCASSDKNKSKNLLNNRYQQRVVAKKEVRDNISNLHNITDTNIFMPVSNCDISIQNAPLVPLPPVTSFHNFPSNYTMCETVPSTTLFNSVSRAHDIPSLSNENFLSHGLNVESQILNNRHLNHDTTVPKPHANLSLPFESHGPLYNNCSFLQNSKSNLDNTRTSDSSVCFQAPTFNNSYSQQPQKPNCCHFSHRTIMANSEIPTEINLSAAPPVPFHTDKNILHANRPPLQPNFSQSNSNLGGNFFYSSNVRDGNIAAKLSNGRIPQEVFVSDSTRQNIHEQSNVANMFPNRKTVSSNKAKSKKSKNLSVNESNILASNNITNFCTTQDSTCNKSSIPYVSNEYFKNNSQLILPPPQLQCIQNKIPNKIVNTVNPPFNPALHQQGEHFFNLNLQPPNLAMNSLPRPPTQPLSCACLTTPIMTHTFASTAHPVPNFNLSNILPDMGGSGNSVSISQAKFPPANHSLQSSTQCHSDTAISNTAHIVSHQSCAPSLYPPHPSMGRGNLNPILDHHQPLNDNQLPLVGAGSAVISHQNAPIIGSQNPTFRNVIHTLNFPRSDH